MTSTKIQFLVKMTCESCVDAVEKSLENVDIKSLEINFKAGSVVIDSSLPILELQKKLESTGRAVAIKGYEGSIAAVSILETGDKNVQGVVRFIQATPVTCIVDGTIDGLKPGVYNIEIHECGDISRGCESVGRIFNPDRNGYNRVYGFLGTITADKNGRSAFRLEDNVIKLSDIIGRSFVVCLKIQGEAYFPVTCGIIARSSGLFENPKTLCACDGTTIWDEVTSSRSKSSL